MISQDNLIPDVFTDHVKDALSNLYSVPNLLTNPLVQEYDAQGQSAAHRLRRDIIEAIETLNPGKTVSIRSTQSRLYNLMHLHYVGAMTLQETAHELGISLRQAYRDLRRGQGNISSILWYKFQRDTPVTHQPENPRSSAQDLSSIDSEIKHLERSYVSVDISTSLGIAIKAVEKLAEQKQILIDVDILETPIVISTHQAIAMQILINLLSQAVQQAEHDTIHVRLAQNDDTAEIQIQYVPADFVSPVITRLMEQVHWQNHIEDGQLSITLNDRGTRVLIIDDNEGLVDLLRHYISSSVYQVFTANNGKDGLNSAVELQPDVIIMDLMMPDMDGWELLQYFRTTPSTQDIPVVICSVIHDPELAYSLGADHFIAKPVTKEQILKMLKELKL